MEDKKMTHKVFISYSWTSITYQEMVKSWAERLISDGIEVIMDIFDLKEGQDKYSFMEKMVNDDTITKVLIFSNKGYAQKANNRKAGVGTESQIISKEIYDNVVQSKFIPILCETDDDGNAFVPTFIASRIWIDFSSPENVNKNWEQLVRAIYEKPLHIKPELGNTPLYITSEEPIPTSHIRAKFETFKQMFLDGKNSAPIFRNEFLDSCLEFADQMRIREDPRVENWGERVLNDARILTTIRNYIVDWVLLESQITEEEIFSDVIINFLNELREKKSRPIELTSFSEIWFEAEVVFVYETFLYIIAALIKHRKYIVLHNVLTQNYILPNSDRYGSNQLQKFDTFFGYSNSLQILAKKGTTLFNPAAEFVYQNVNRNDVSFKNLTEGDSLLLMISLINKDFIWRPHTLYYLRYHDYGFPLFLNASDHKGFLKLAIIIGIDSADQLRMLIDEGFERSGIRHWDRFNHNFSEMWNLKNLDTIN